MSHLTKRTKPVRRPVDNAHLPTVFRMVGPYRNVIPVDERDLEIMASRRVRLMATKPPIDLVDSTDGRSQ